MPIKSYMSDTFPLQMLLDAFKFCLNTLKYKDIQGLLTV
jgi:hypothetical protein